MAKRRKQPRRPAGSGALTAGSAQVMGSGTVKWRKLVSLVLEERRKQFKAEDWALLDAVHLVLGAARQCHCGLSMLSASAMCDGACFEGEGP